MAEENPTPPTTETTTETHATVKTSVDSTSPRFDDWTRALLSMVVVLGFEWIIIFGQITGKQVPEGILTTYVGFVMLALGYYLGSSSGSAAKDKAAGKI